MNEARADLWSYIGKVDAIFITTNMAAKNNGNAVMGRGCAFEAATRWPNIPNVLGRYLMQGNHFPVPLWRIGPTDVAGQLPTQLWSFPVKDKGFVPQTPEELNSLVTTQQVPRMSVGKFVPSWARKASLELIADSARYIQALDIKSAVLPRPGCGAGELDWDTVSETLHSILDDRFTCTTWK